MAKPITRRQGDGRGALPGAGAARAAVIAAHGVHAWRGRAATYTDRRHANDRAACRGHNARRAGQED